VAYDRDYYVILGIEEDATIAEVRSAYRRAARAHHPDLHPSDAGATDRFKRIQEAYDVLGDPVRRAAYRRPLTTSRPTWRSTGYAAGRRPSGYAATWSRPPAADPALAAELAEALLVLRMLGRQAQLEQRLRRLIRYLEGL
jgi:curved DNA-binding protein CbpA